MKQKYVKFTAKKDFQFSNKRKENRTCSLLLQKPTRAGRKEEHHVVFEANFLGWTAHFRRAFENELGGEVE